MLRITHWHTKNTTHYCTSTRLQNHNHIHITTFDPSVVLCRCSRWLNKVLMHPGQLHPTPFQGRLCSVDALCAAVQELYTLINQQVACISTVVVVVVGPWVWAVHGDGGSTRRHTHRHEKVEGTGGGGGGQRERGDTTGGTYCQVGPRGVARVAPLSDSTHKRGGGQKH